MNNGAPDWKPIALVPLLALVVFPLIGSPSTWLTLTVAGLAMGLGGIALAIIICGYAMRAAVARGHRGELFLFLTFIYWLVEAQFSGAVWSNVMLWLSVAILIPTRISSGQNPLGVRGLNDLELYRDDWRKRNSAATQVFSNKERGVRK